MEHLLFIAIVLALVEWRRFQNQADFKAIQSQVKENHEAIVLSLKVNADEQSRAIKELTATIRPLEEFIRQAHADLGAVVKEREFQRNELREVSYDTVEGL